VWQVSVKGVLGWDGAVVLLRNDRDEWELPGGRLGAGEQPPDALRREIAEELGLRAEMGALLLAESFEVVPGRWVLVLAYRCAAPRPRELSFSEEHCAVTLASLEALDSMALPDVYRRAIRASSEL
jgi:8-oxo-dGTP pyrophosphatase MutT (NUDIX family)